MLTLLLGTTYALAQPANIPALDYTPVADTFSLPAGMNFGSVSGVAVNSKGRIFVLHRGPQPLMEFDAGGAFIRAWGDWHRYGHLRMFNEPNDVAIGQVYVADTLNWRVQKYVKQ